MYYVVAIKQCVSCIGQLIPGYDTVSHDVDFYSSIAASLINGSCETFYFLPKIYLQK